MKCMKCNNSYPDEIIYKIVDKKGTKCLCPNCCALEEIYGTLNFENDYDLNCSITGKPGAVIFSSGNETYILEKEIMHRLLRYDLSPEEYFKLKDDSKGFQYMLHDDFYTENGEAIQPLEVN